MVERVRNPNKTNHPLAPGAGTAGGGHPMTPEMQAAVEWVRNLYEQTGITYKAFAELCGTSTSAARSWIKGLQCPTAESLRKVGEAYGIQPPPHILLGAQKYQAEVLAKSVQGTKDVYAAKRQRKLSPVYHWEHDGKAREFCKEKHCEWVDRNGICTWGHCMKGSGKT